MKILTSIRFWLAGPIVLFTAVAVMAASALWLPKGNANIDNLVLPVIFFPLIWGVLFFYVVLETNMRRCALVIITLFIVHTALVTASIMGQLHY